LAGCGIDETKEKGYEIQRGIQFDESELEELTKWITPPKLPSIFDNLSDSLENRSDSLRKVMNDFYPKDGEGAEARIREILLDSESESSNGISDFEIFKPEIDFNDSIP
jgi:hypothetical protein